MKFFKFIKSLFSSDSNEEVSRWGRSNIYKDSGLRWRWRLLDTEGVIVAASCQSFADEDSATAEFNHARSVMFGVKAVPVKSNLQ